MDGQTVWEPIISQILLICLLLQGCWSLSGFSQNP